MPPTTRRPYFFPLEYYAKTNFANERRKEMYSESFRRVK